jgi:hypothetical protein
MKSPKNRENPFEFDSFSEFTYDREKLRENYGADAMAHLKTPQPDTDSDEAFDIIFELTPGFEEWLIENERRPLLVMDWTIGLADAETGEPFTDTGYVVISKPKETVI